MYDFLKCKIVFTLRLCVFASLRLCVSATQKKLSLQIKLLL